MAIAAVIPGRYRTRPWGIVAALSVTETVSWGVLYYAFAAFLVPMQEDLGFSEAALTGAFSLGLLVSAVAGIAVGRHLDRHGPRALMTVASCAGVLLVLAWSAVDGLVLFYVLWVGIGLVMAAVLYEPAFTVLAKHFTAAQERRRAMTALTLVAALSSFIFLPLSQALIDAHGWRNALVALGVVLAVVTVPLHAVVLRSPARSSAAVDAGAHAPVTARQALHDATFWLLTTAFVLAMVAGIGVTILAIPYLLTRGYSAEFAAFAVGLVGLAQIPGRLLFAALAARLPVRWSTACVFLMVAVGIAILVGPRGTVAVVAGLVVLGMGNGMTTLARATSIADLYGSAAYGTIGATAGALTTAARALGPVVAALYAAAAGYTAMLWTLAAVALLAAVLAYRAVRG